MDSSILTNTVFFKNMSEKELSSAVQALEAVEKKYAKGAAVFHAGSYTKHMGLVIQGSITVESNDIWGNRTILSHVGKGQFFAETYALLENQPMLVDVVANEDTAILFLNVSNLHTIDVSANPWALKLFLNLLTILSNKNLHLSGRSFHTSPKTIRGRVMAYLNSMALQTQKKEFYIPFDRQQLADYLNLERSALSKELGKMQKEGIIITKKNYFKMR